jgi:predicted NAD/FAD-dependent oxidoreductase
MHIGIIGAGFSGLLLANRLKDYATNITVLEKSKGVSGRLATRRAIDYHFDHGAQFFAARSKRFLNFLQPLVDNKIIIPWKGDFAELDYDKVLKTRKWDDEPYHYIGNPSMSAIGKFLAKDIDVHKETKVLKAYKNKSWVVKTQTNSYEFDILIFAIPCAQVKEIIDIPVTDTMIPCFSLMTKVDNFDWPYNANFVKNSKISWFSYNKPTAKKGTLVVLSTNQYALDNNKENAIDDLTNEIRLITKQNINFEYKSLQHWRYANAKKGTGMPFYYDVQNKIASCGDWYVRGTVEGAFKSSSALAKKIIDYLKTL